VETRHNEHHKNVGRFTAASGDGDGRTEVSQGGAGGSFDPVYSPPTRGACYQYAIVTEKTSTTKNVKICGTDRRERNVYTSRSNVVEVRFITSANVDTDKEYYFLLQFEGLSIHLSTIHFFFFFFFLLLIITVRRRRRRTTTTTTRNILDCDQARSQHFYKGGHRTRRWRDRRSRARREGAKGGEVWGWAPRCMGIFEKSTLKLDIFLWF